MNPPTEPTDPPGDRARDLAAELAAAREAIEVLAADRDAAVASSIRRRDRMLDQIDRLQADLRRIRSDLRRASSWFGVRAARGVRRRVRAGLNRLMGSGVGRGRTTDLNAATAAAGATGAAATFRADLTERLSGTAAGRRAVRVAVLGRPTSSHGAAHDQPDLERTRAGLAALGLDAFVPDAGPEPIGIDATTDVVLLLDPAVDTAALSDRLVTVAWLGDRPEPWLARSRVDDLDLVLVADAATQARVEAVAAKTASVAADPATPVGADAIRAALLRWLAARHVAIHIPPTTREAAAVWGDTPFGRSLQRAFERRGWPATVHVFAERDSAAAVRADLALHIFGLRAPAARPGQPTVLWIISHPDLVRRELCLAYDLIGVASDPFMAFLRAWLGPDSPPLFPLHQATDPDRFHPAPGGPAHELLFVGSSRDGRRPVIDDLAGTPHDLAVYGRKWTDTSLDARHLRGEWIPNDRLHQYYASAAIVLSDTAIDMRDEGFIANRVYDVLASGGFAISDEVAGIDAEFDGAVPVYRDRNELWRLVGDYLARPDARAELAERGRRAVLDRHTFGHRVDAILEAVDARAIASDGPQAAGGPTAKPRRAAPSRAPFPDGHGSEGT